MGLSGIVLDILPCGINQAALSSFRIIEARLHIFPSVLLGRFVLKQFITKLKKTMDSVLIDSILMASVLIDSSRIQPMTPKFDLDWTL